MIFPKALVPAFNTRFPLTETSCAIFATKLLPTTVCELIRLTVLTVSVVPAGIVAEKDDWAAATKAPLAIAIRMNVFLVIFKSYRLMVKTDYKWKT